MLTLVLGFIAWLTGMKTFGEVAIKYGIGIIVFGIIVLQAIKQLKRESMGHNLRQISGEESRLVKEIALTCFDENEVPLLRIYSNGTSSLMFEMFPPENNKLTSSQVENFRTILAEITGVDIIHDDRETFLILSNENKVINRVVQFFEEL